MGSFAVSNVYDFCLINEHHYEVSVAVPCLLFVLSFKLKEIRGGREKHRKQVYKIISNYRFTYMLTKFKFKAC